MSFLDRDRLARMFGISIENQMILDEGSNHPSSCTCDVCKKWWKLMGPDEDGNYGPFTKAEVEGNDQN